MAYGRGFDRKAPAEPAHRINELIRVPEVRLIGPDGDQLGIVPIEKALAIANEAELDLVEVAPKANPPVCRVLDYGKFRYELQKKEKDSRKKGHSVQIKKVRVGPKISENDYQVKLRAIRSFLEDGDKVKVTMMFKGRMVTHKDLGREVLERFVQDTAEIGKLEGTIQMEGHRNMVMTLQKK